MIAACPQCQTRFRIPREKLGPQGARLRCSGCSNVFRVRPPQAEAPAPSEPLPPVARALVAEADAARGKAIADWLAKRRIEGRVFSSGVDALLAMFRQPPDVVVLGSDLPDLDSAILCEVARRSGSLAGLPIVRVAPASAPELGPELEADERLEPGDLPAGLASLLERREIGTPPPSAADTEPAAPTAAPSAPAPPVAVVPTPSVDSAPSDPKSADPKSADPKSADQELAKAERLARITVSDIVLYNEEKFSRAASSGDVAAAFVNELAEARPHFDSRVPEPVRGDRDLLTEELERRARKARA